MRDPCLPKAHRDEISPARRSAHRRAFESEEDAMTLAETFDTLAKEWAEHCRRVMHRSNPADYLRCPAYQRLVALGPAAVPLVMERYESDTSVPWESVVEAITGTSMTKDPTFIDPDEVLRLRTEWWARERGNFPVGQS
jgi:hypothetical protein